MFRQEDPSTHVIKLKPFWIIPWGPAMLSHQFEWNVNGSDDGNLASSISDQLDSVLELTVAILGRKKGDAWKRKYNEVETISANKHGNDNMKNVFMIESWQRVGVMIRKSYFSLKERMIFKISVNSLTFTL